MTAVIGIVSDDKIYIGGDSAGTDIEHNVTILAQDKVNKRGEVLMGIAGGFRPAQVLAYNVPFPDKDEEETVDQYIYGKFVPMIQNTMRGAFCLKREHDLEKMNATFLFGVYGKLFAIQNDFGVVDSTDGFLAIGSGEKFCLGALHVLKDSGIKPQDKLFMALEAAEHYNGAVRRPFIVMNSIGEVWEKD